MRRRPFSFVRPYNQYFGARAGPPQRGYYSFIAGDWLVLSLNSEIINRGPREEGMRHKVMHDYLGVDEDIVWQVVTRNLPALVKALEPLMPPAPE